VDSYPPICQIMMIRWIAVRLYDLLGEIDGCRPSI
jgi:hypothetical protein